MIGIHLAIRLKQVIAQLPLLLLNSNPSHLTDHLLSQAITLLHDLRVPPTAQPEPVEPRQAIHATPLIPHLRYGLAALQQQRSGIFFKGPIRMFTFSHNILMIQNVAAYEYFTEWYFPDADIPDCIDPERRLIRLQIEVQVNFQQIRGCLFILYLKFQPFSVIHN